MDDAVMAVKLNPVGAAGTFGVKMYAVPAAMEAVWVLFDAAYETVGPVVVTS